MEITLNPEDNHRLANLCGALDENLKQIEDALDVGIARRGSTFHLSGEQQNMQLAVQLLENFYVRAKKPISLEEIQLGLVELDKLNPEAISGNAMPVLMTRRQDLHGRTPRQVEYLQQIQEFDITFGIGPAGTGKTYLAVAAAVDALMRKRVKRIILARPAVEAGESLGFLPGDLQAKVDPYLRPLYDALDEMMPQERVQKALETRTIEIAPLAFMRGRTLGDAFVILDEAQNATGAQMKMFLTRLGVNSKVVVTGDKTQIDLPKREESGIMQIERILSGIEGISFHYLADADVVRHRLVRDIIRAYAEDAGG